MNPMRHWLRIISKPARGDRYYSGDWLNAVSCDACAPSRERARAVAKEVRDAKSYEIVGLFKFMTITEEL